MAVVLNGSDNADNVATFINSAEGAGVAAGTAGNAFFVVDNSLAVGADADGAKCASTDTGTVDFNNSAIGAYLFAFAAFYAFVAVDEGSVLNQGNSFLRAVVHAFMGDAVTADIGYIVGINGALVAGCREHVDQRQVFALRLVHGLFGSLDNVFLTFLPQRHIDTVFQNGSFLIHAAAIAGSVVLYFLQNIINMVNEHVVPSVAGQML